MKDLTEHYSDRQYELTAVADLSYSDLTEDEVTEIFELPAGAIITGISLQVVTAWNSSTPVLAVGTDSLDPDEYLDNVSLAAEANFPVSNLSADDDTNLFTGDANLITVPTTIKVLYAAASGTASAGRAILTVKYIVLGRSNENQG